MALFAEVERRTHSGARVDEDFIKGLALDPVRGLTPVFAWGGYPAGVDVQPIPNHEPVRAALGDHILITDKGWKVLTNAEFDRKYQYRA